MKEYSYIGVAEDLAEGVKFLVRSKTHTINRGDIVLFPYDGCVFAEVLHSAFFENNSAEEAIMSEFGEIHDVVKIYRVSWDKKKEEEKNA